MLLYRILSASALLICPAAGFAQTVNDGEKCVVERQSQADLANPRSDNSFTEFLDECHGVIKPPPVGDEEIRQPAPKEGKTPIIKPGELPKDS